MPIIGALATSAYLFAIAFVVVSVFMILVILVQRPKGGGLSSAFGGGAGTGSSQAVIGNRVGDVLTWTTVISFCLFLLLAMFIIWQGNPEDDAGVDTPDTVQATDGEVPTGGVDASEATEDTTSEEAPAEPSGASAPAEGTPSESPESDAPVEVSESSN